MLGDTKITGIDAVHPSIKEYKECFTKMRDFSLGESAVKAKRLAYYPKYNTQRERSYDKALKMAPFEDWVPSLIETYCSLIFSKPPIVETPKVVDVENSEDILDSLISPGWTFNQFTLKFVSEYITMGRVGLWASIDKNGNSKLISYPSESIINWKRDSDGKLEYVILEEKYFAPGEENEFALEEKCQYRALYMKEGVANVAVYKELNKTDGVALQDRNYEIVPEESFVLEKKNGSGDDKYLTELPFWIFTVSGNPSLVEKPPLLPVVNLNEKHYIVSGGRMMSLHYAAFPLLMMKDQKDAAADEMPTDKFQAGPDTVLYTGEKGDVKYVTFGADGVAAASETLKDFKEALGMLSRRLLDSKKGIVVESGKGASSEKTHRFLSIGTNERCPF